MSAAHPRLYRVPEHCALCMFVSCGCFLCVGELSFIATGVGYVFGSCRWDRDGLPDFSDSLHDMSRLLSYTTGLRAGWLLVLVLHFTAVCFAQSSTSGSFSANARGPDSSSKVVASETSSAPAQTHTVQVGLADHKFRPDVIAADVGDVSLLFHYNNRLAYANDDRRLSNSASTPRTTASSAQNTASPAFPTK